MARREKREEQVSFLNRVFSVIIKKSILTGKKQQKYFLCLPPSFVCNGVLKSYFMSLLTDICSALNNMNYILRYKLLILLDFVLWHLLYNVFVTFFPVPANVATDCHKTSTIGETRCIWVMRSDMKRSTNVDFYTWRAFSVQFWFVFIKRHLISFSTHLTVKRQNALLCGLHGVRDWRLDVFRTEPWYDTGNAISHGLNSSIWWILHWKRRNLQITWPRGLEGNVTLM